MQRLLAASYEALLGRGAAATASSAASWAAGTRQGLAGQTRAFQPETPDLVTNMEQRAVQDLQAIIEAQKQEGMSITGQDKTMEAEEVSCLLWLLQPQRVPHRVWVQLDAVFRCSTVREALLSFTC